MGPQTTRFCSYLPKITSPTIKVAVAYPTDISLLKLLKTAKYDNVCEGTGPVEVYTVPVAMFLPKASSSFTNPLIPYIPGRRRVDLLV